MSTDTPGPGHNRPKKTIELDQDLLEFAELNCDTNIRMMLLALNPVGGVITHRDIAEDCIEMIEKFKRLREALREAR